ncbi:glycosyltransferase family 4 protein [Chromohalobacter israelensis]|uniref:glycosyltransferase family 4 protein n=1 Tax=Chromohalobacter israelensis TaxID=141390 RepID=UPI00265C092A|nr:glycosyltransferase [Chromohalobacter salexigens]MDO0946705.1 glycosyltransferase [Chromohalobacter salexigens]
MSFRISFFSARDYGQLGTPGTYRIVEELRKYFEVRVFCRPPSDRSVHDSRLLPFFPIRGFNKASSLKPFLPALKEFNPDIVYIFAAPGWHEVLKVVKSELPNTKVILDIKTPLLVEDKNERENIQKEGEKSVGWIDRLISHSEKSVKTWLPSWSSKIHVFPPGVDVSQFRKTNKRSLEEKTRENIPLQLLYAASLQQKRESEHLVEGFKRFLEEFPGKAFLHIYGDGPDRRNLENKVAELRLSDWVFFHGLVSQKKLFSEMVEMDGAIGWVPKSLYNESPSLKVLEYVAAELPVLATATAAHKKMEEEGFSLDFCDDNSNSLAKGLSQWVINGFGESRVKKNRQVVLGRDYSRMTRERMLPILCKLLDGVHEGDELKDQKEKEPEISAKGITYKEKPLRILLVLDSLALGQGGAERIISDLASELCLRDFQVYLAYADHGKPSYSVNESVVLLPYSSLSHLEQFVKMGRLDVMTVFYFNERNLIPFVEIADDNQVPLVIQECTNPDRLRFNSWRQGRVGRARASWERELVISVATRIRMVMPGYVKSIPAFQQPSARGFANSARITDKRATPTEAYDGRWSILIVNGFKGNKNLKDLALAFCQIEKEFPEWDLRIVGKPPVWERPHLREIYKIFNDNKIWGRVSIVGPTEDIQKEYARSHIHVISSLSEGCPTVVLEAMAVGLPSIGFADCPGTNELIQHESNGLLVRESDRVNGLAGALARLIENSEERNKFGEQARVDAETFDPRKVYDQWESLLKEAATYKDDPDRLLREQKNVDYERALHADRMCKTILRG